MIKKIKDLTVEEIASICDHTYLKRPEEFRTIAKTGESPVKLWEKDFNKFLEIMSARTGLKKTKANIKKIFSILD